MDASNEFAGKVAVVTGGGSGLGRASAQRLAAAGAAVVVSSNDRRSIDEAAESLRAGGARAAAKYADAADAGDMAALAAFAVETFGGVDIVVNSAAIQPYGAVVSMAPEDWDRVIAVNLRSVYLSGHFCIPLMIERGGGAMVNIASVQGLATQARVAAYSTSKAAVIGLTRAMALDHAEDGVRVNAVCPASIDAPMLRFSARENKGEGTEEEIIAKWGAMHPLGRIGRPAEVAELVAFLAGPRASFITGAEYKIDGGLMAKLGVILPD